MKQFIILLTSIPLFCSAEVVSLFNGTDFTGWTAEDPHKRANLKKKNPEKLDAYIAREAKDFPKHWQVKDGVIYNDGFGPYLKTEKEYGDIELELQFKLHPKSDSGIYLRGCPQVQLWDTREEAGYHKHGADKGSGGLWNNRRAGRNPLVHADKPIGEWNHIRIRQVGDITSVWLNDQLVVDKAPMENYWNRKAPFPEKGHIYLQTHGAPIEWKDIKIKELGEGKASASSSSADHLPADETSLPEVNEEEMELVSLIHEKLTAQAAEEKSAEAYTETLSDGTAFEMLPVKGGSFTWKGAEDHDTLEVTLTAYWLGKHEVTWEEYEPFMLSEIPRQKDGSVLSFMREQIENEVDLLARPTPPYMPMSFGMPKEGHPAISMTQHAANKYCQWLSYQTGHFYRLPTEAEWEYACRAGADTTYSWGNDAAKAGDYVWSQENAEAQYQQPGQKKANSWGFHDMSGNVLEWTLDQHLENRRNHFGKKAVMNVGEE